MPDQIKIPDARMLIEATSKAAEDIFAEDQQVTPFWQGFTASGDHKVFKPPPGLDKAMCVILVRALFELYDVVCCVFCDEAWVAAATEDDIKALDAWLDAGNSLETYADRKEVVVFMAEDGNGQLTGHRPIDRSGRKPKLGPLVINDLTGATTEGRLTGMLPRRGATVQ